MLLTAYLWFVDELLAWVVSFAFVVVVWLFLFGTAWLAKTIWLTLKRLYYNINNRKSN